MAGAPKGNTNATKGKMWAAAVRKAIREGDNLEKIAKELVRKATDGDMMAIKEIGDRLDGKAHQTSSSDVNVKVGYAGILEEFSQRYDVQDAGEVAEESGSVCH